MLGRGHKPDGGGRSKHSSVQYQHCIYTCVQCRHSASLTTLRRGAAGAQSENSMISQSLDRQTSDSEKWPSKYISILARTTQFGQMMINSVKGSRALINLSCAITDSTLTDREGLYFFSGAHLTRSMTLSRGAELTGSSLIMMISSPGSSFPSDGPPTDTMNTDE